MFLDRFDAGQKLAAALSSYSRLPNHLIVALPRGGVVIAQEVSLALHLPLDFISVRKIGAPQSPELAIGAIAGDVVYLNQPIIEMVGASEIEINQIIERERQEAARRELLYRGTKKPHPLKNQTVILVDDGIATGATLYASVLYLRQQDVRSIIIAVPVAAPSSLAFFEKEVDQVVCLLAPPAFSSVSQFYSEFSAVSDEEVCNILKSISPKGF